MLDISAVSPVKYHAAEVNDVIKLVAGEDATFTDPELAASGSAPC
jgi:hypothetical protein